MARPCESRNDLLNRWVRMKREEQRAKSWEKPSDPGTVGTIEECTTWRRFVNDQLDVVLTKLYDDRPPDAETRNLNDQANKLANELQRWNDRIKELGGVDYAASVAMPDDPLNDRSGNYQYFGRARQLPEVQALMEPVKLQPTSSKDKLLKCVDADYYGYCPSPELLSFLSSAGS